MVNVAQRRAYMSATDLCFCKFFDNFTDNASAEALPGRAAQAAAARTRAQSEPDGGRAWHLRVLPESPRAQSAAGDCRHPAAAGAGVRRRREDLRVRKRRRRRREPTE